MNGLYVGAHGIRPREALRPILIPHILYLISERIMRYLKDKDIAAALQQNPPLVEGVTNLATQLQPNGIDLTVHSIVRVTGAARVGFSSDETKPAPAEALEFDADGWLFLPSGNYRARLAERVNIPSDVV